MKTSRRNGGREMTMGEGRERWGKNVGIWSWRWRKTENDDNEDKESSKDFQV